MAIASKIVSTVPKNIQINLFPFYSCYDSYVLNKLGFKAKGFSSNSVVHEFWKCFKSDKARVLKIAEKLQNSINQFTFPLNQKNWAKYNDPFVRSAYFFLLSNLSTLGLASTGALKKSKTISFDFSHINEDTYNLSLISDNKLNRLIKDNSCLAVNAGSFSLDILSHAEGSAIDQVRLKSDSTISLCRESYEPWIIGFDSNEAILEYAQGLNIYFYDALGQLTNKDNSKVYLVSNV